MRLKILNEKCLVLFLFFLSIFGMFLIMMNLPTDVKRAYNARVRDVFIPEHLNDIKHDDNHQHAAPPIFKEDSDKTTKIVDFEIPDINDLKKTDPIELDKKKDPAEFTVEDKRDFIKKMTKFGYNMYEKYAWGENELKPLSKRGHSAGIFGSSTKLGATIVDGLDTLYIMGFMEEYERGKEWIINNFNINVNSDVSIFEVNIRFIGGFLSLYTLSKEKVFLDKAEDVAKLLLPAFNTPTGIPYALINPKTKQSKNYNWASGGCSILSEFGTLSLEFDYLSDLTGDPIYSEKISKINQVLEKTTKTSGLYYNYLNPATGKWCVNHATIGALADSFYEYLLKIWIYKGKTDGKALDVYLKTMKSMREQLVLKSPKNLSYFAELQNNRKVKKMDHLACFSAGLLALTSSSVDSFDHSEKNEYMELAKAITNTCHESYIRTNTHIGPESFRFENENNEAMALRNQDKYYILRPEVIEAYFYLWRTTKDPKYREWAWDAAQSIEKHCRTEFGYSGIKNVYASTVEHDDVQQSFFFAETLKYLYLIFSDDDVISLDKYVLNTEAHPFLIKTSSS